VKAWQVTELGEPIDVLRLGEVAEPEPGPGQVAVRVRAAAANFPDVLMARGHYQVRPPLPFTPGIEACGDVVAVGADVTHVAVGDRVLGGAEIPNGSFADVTLMSGTDTFLAPGSLDDASSRPHGPAVDMSVRPPLAAPSAIQCFGRNGPII